MSPASLSTSMGLVRFHTFRTLAYRHFSYNEFSVSPMFISLFFPFWGNFCLTLSLDLYLFLGLTIYSDLPILSRVMPPRLEQGLVLMMMSNDNDDE